MSTPQLQITPDDRVLVVRINMDAFPTVGKAWDALQRAAAAEHVELSRVAGALLIHSIASCGRDPGAELLSVPGVCVNEKPL
jgi:hypothetical protein